MVGLNRKVILTVKLFRSMVHVYIYTFTFISSYLVCILFGVPSFTFLVSEFLVTTMTSLLFYFHILMSTQTKRTTNWVAMETHQDFKQILETLGNPLPKPWQQCMS